MKRRDRIKRAVAFYASVLLFVILLPIILSYSLGYKIDYKGLTIYKTGIIYIESHPAGADIYINGRKHPDPTPARIEELKPGLYKIEVKRDGFYTWEREVAVKANMVTRADRIVLFKIAKDADMVARREVSDFLVTDRGVIYYMSKDGLFVSGNDGNALKKLSPYSEWPDGIIGKKLSPDGNKLLYFTRNMAGIIHLDAEKISGPISTELLRTHEAVFNTPEHIIDIFWYSAGGYIIVVTSRDVEVVELTGGEGRNIVTLYRFSSPPRSVSYNENNDALYFTDADKDAPSSNHAYLYRLDLRQKFFETFMKLIMKKNASGKP